MDYADQPSTPLHPAADEEFRAPKNTQNSGIVLDLNPDLSDDDDGVTRRLDETLRKQDQQKANESSSLDSEMFEDVAIRPKRKLEYSSAEESGFESANASPIPEFHTDTPTPQRHLTAAQQQKLMAYLEEELMKIQRRHVQSYLDLPEKVVYHTILDVLKDYTRLVDFLWYTIRSVKSRIFFQSQYLLRVAGDVVDIMESYPPKTQEALRDVLVFFVKIDGVFQQVAGKLDTTEKVRLMSIAERTRVTVVNMVDGLQLGYRAQIGAIYEKTIDTILDNDVF